jgi:hypothetical protein
VLLNIKQHIKSALEKLIKNHKKVILFLLIMDFILLILHLLLGSQLGFFHLDYEKNLPTTYQSLKLIVFGGIFLYLGLKTKLAKEAKIFAIMLGLAIIGLGLDEGLEIHENIWQVFEYIPFLRPDVVVPATLEAGFYSSIWLVYYTPIIAAFLVWCGYWLRYFHKKIPSNIGWIVSSLVFITVVVVMELLSSTGMYPDHTYFIMITIEETAEMLFATTIIMVGLKTIKHGMKTNK